MQVASEVSREVMELAPQHSSSWTFGKKKTTLQTELYSGSIGPLHTETLQNFVKPVGIQACMQLQAKGGSFSPKGPVLLLGVAYINSCA